MTPFRRSLFVPLALTTACTLDRRSPGVLSDGGVEASICVGTPVRSALITDFSDAVVGTYDGQPQIQFGGTAGPFGTVYFGGAASLVPPAPSLEQRGDDQGLRITLAPGVPVNSEETWLYAGLYLGNRGCLDASAYSGVEFSFAGALGTCQFAVAVPFSQDESSAFGPGNLCTLGNACYPPHSGRIIPDATGAVRVPFASLTDGIPINTLDASQLLDIEWRFVAPVTGEPCAASFVIDDVAFFP